MTVCVGELCKRTFDASSNGIIGEIVQAFKNTSYVKTIGGDLFCITVYPVRAPWNVNLEHLQEWPEVGSKVHKEKYLLRAGSLHVDLEDPITYRSKSGFKITEGFDKRLREAQVALSITDVGGSILDSNSIFYNKLSKGILQIAKAVQREDYEKLRQAIPTVLGLGNGFTPSGDDFLVGLLFTLNKILSTKGHEPLVFDLWGKTSWISARFIEYAQAGYVTQPLEEMVYTLLCGDLEDMAFSVADVTRIGHSSGIDAAIGVLVAANYGKDEEHQTFLRRMFSS